MAHDAPTPAVETRHCAARLPRPLWIAMVVGLLIAVGIGLRFGLPIYRQQSATEQIKLLGGIVGKRPRGPAWMKRLLGAERKSRLIDVTISVDLNDERATDGTLVHITALTELEWLSLDGAQVTDMGVVQLGNLQRLKWLTLNDTKITDGSLPTLACLKHLESVSLCGTEVTDVAITRFAEVPDLRILKLSGTGVTDSGLQLQHGFDKLKQLWLDGTAVTSAGVARFRQHHPAVDVIR